MTRNNDKAGQIMQKEEVKDQKMLKFIQDNENLQKLVDKFGIILKNGNEDQFVTKWAFSPVLNSLQICGDEQQIEKFKMYIELRMETINDN